MLTFPFTLFSSETYPAPQNAYGPITYTTGINEWSNRTVRMIVPKAYLADVTGTQIRITVKQYNALSLRLSTPYIGFNDSAGAASDFDGNQVPVKFDGVNSLTIQSPSFNETVTSDWADLVYDNTEDLIFFFLYIYFRIFVLPIHK